MANERVWVVHSPIQIADQVEKSGMVAIGWSGEGNLASYKTREQLRERFLNSGVSEGKASNWAGQLHRFVHEVNVGDFVLTPLKLSREVLIGEITSQYIHDPKAISSSYPNIRKVSWLKKVSRDLLSSAFRNSIGGASTVFTVDSHLDELKKFLTATSPTAPSPSQEPAEDYVLYEDVRSKAEELIADLLTRLDAYDFQGLIAGLLTAMGFKTRVSSPGRDYGVDILAFPDAFGFQLPRIKVQVKHRKGQASAPEIQALAGTLGQGENGLFVSTGGFTTAAANEAQKRTNIALIDRDQFIDLLLEHYERLEPQYQAMVPLRKVYIPVPPEYSTASGIKK